MLQIRLRFSGPTSGLSGNYRAAVRTVEAGSALSSSILWRLVPTDAVSTPPGAGTRAAACILAWFEQVTGIDESEPIDIVELSAGEGGYSRELVTAIAASPHADRFRVLLTDPDRRTAELLARDKVLRPLIRAGRVDVACYDPAVDPLVAPITKGDNLVPDHAVNPVVVCSHGDLGRRPADLLRFDMGRIREATVMLTGPTSIPDPPRQEHLSRLILEWRWRDIDSGVYQDDRVREAVEDMADELDEGAVPIPLGAVHAIDRLRALAGGRLLLVAEEGGTDDLDALVVDEAPSDGIALPTNLYALASVVRESGGTVAVVGAGEENSAMVCAFGQPGVQPLGLTGAWCGDVQDEDRSGIVARLQAEGFNPALLLDVDWSSEDASDPAVREAVACSLALLERLVADPALADRVGAWLASPPR